MKRNQLAKSSKEAKPIMAKAERMKKTVKKRNGVNVSMKMKAK
jgi:hypothetical protein